MKEKINKRLLKSQNTKKMIFDQATKLFKEKGYYNVSIEEITSALNLSVGSFYHHFKSKDELVLIWADDLDLQYNEYYDKIKDCLKYNAVDKIREMMFFSISIYSYWGNEFTEVSYSYMMREQKASMRMLNPDRSYFKIINDLVEEGKLKGLIRTDINTKQMVSDIIMVARGAIMDWCINGGTGDIRSRSSTLVCSYIDGISIKTEKADV